MYNGGMASFHWCPVSFVTGVWAAFMYGTFISVPSGFLVWIYSPFVIISGVEVFLGLGGCLFVGAGGAVMGRSQLIEIIAIVNLHCEYMYMHVLYVSIPRLSLLLTHVYFN